MQDSERAGCMVVWPASPTGLLVEARGGHMCSTTMHDQWNKQTHTLAVVTCPSVQVTVSVYSGSRACESPCDPCDERACRGGGGRAVGR
eukprot:6858580-Prymnesium_polylepis.1